MTNKKDTEKKPPEPEKELKKKIDANVPQIRTISEYTPPSVSTEGYNSSPDNHLYVIQEN